MMHMHRATVEAASAVLMQRRRGEGAGAHFSAALHALQGALRCTLILSQACSGTASQAWCTVSTLLQAAAAGHIYGECG